MNDSDKIERDPSKVPVALLILSMCLFALGAPVTKWLAMHSSMLGFDRGPAISFCNLLFMGNLCAGVIALVTFGITPVLNDLRQTRSAGRSWLLLASVTSVIPPAMLFFSLQWTSVTSAVLLSRLGPLLYTLVQSKISGVPIRANQWLGYGVITVSLLIVTLAGNGGYPRPGDLLVLGSGVAYCLVALFSRSAVKFAGVKVFMVSRNLTSAVIFFSIAVQQYGWLHFSDVFHPRIWIVVSVYALVTVVAAQAAWYYALPRVPASAIGTWSFVLPTAGIAFAYLLLGENPPALHWVALGLTVAGIVIANTSRTIGQPGGKLEHAVGSSPIATLGGSG